MKRLFFCAILGALGMAPAMFADVIDYMLNVNGTTYCPGYPGGTTCSNTGGFAAAPGVTSNLNTAFDTTGNNAPPYGLGSVNVTFNPGAPGSYNVDLWLFEELVPTSGADEYGAIGGGSPASGQSWQIDTPDYVFGGGQNTSATGTIIANTAAGSLSNANDVPGNTDDFLLNCGPGPTCNDYTSMALGENFTLASGFEELLTFTMSTTAPTNGFYLEQIDPGITGTTANYFYSVTASTIPVCPVTAACGTVPEPSSFIPELVFFVAGAVWFVIRRRSSVEA